ncbi:MAG TPA: LuxR C-terminal-related transcriptional regulator [Thermomicrobiales bacterium]|nr:LuxR C-terminal-related transcriptional regulator [Thermomicrobiales bacterium]
MPETILATKLYIPPPQPRAVLRSRLSARLDEGLSRKLTLVSASAGFGKTTLVSEWVAGCGRPVAWLSLDEADSDPMRFLSYLVAALRTVAPDVGRGALGMLQSPQPPPVESLLTALLNELASIPDDVVLVLDDYHVLDATAVDSALAFLLERLPPRLRLVIVSREDPRLPLARLRVRDQLTELRVADLRFTPSEAAEFLNQSMGLSLTEQDIAALDTRTEGWIAGLQLAAISLRGLEDASSFIASFTGSHRFVLDYLLEEVLHRQSDGVQAFLLRTSILDRMCGPLCDAVLLDSTRSGHETLETLEHANLFIVPLDNERRWYRYHHLFAELLRQRLRQSVASSPGDELAELHIRASAWLEDNGLELEAFHHATAANDIERAAHLIDGKGMPLHFRGGMIPILSWLTSLPESTLNAWPSLWTTYASLTLITGRTSGVEGMLQAAEAALLAMPPDATTRDRIGRNAAVWATLAANLNQGDAIVAHSHRALEYLHPDNLAFRTSTVWKLGYAYYLRKEYAAAGRAFADTVAASEASGNAIFVILATIGLGHTRELSNDLHRAAESFRHALQLLSDLALPVAGDAHIGLARICYEWNDLQAAREHGQSSIAHARQKDTHDRLVRCLVVLASIERAEGHPAEAAELVAEAERCARQHNLAALLPEIAAVQIQLLLDEGCLSQAAELARAHDLPASQARVALARGNAPAALAILAPFRQHLEAREWQNELLRAIVLQASAQQAHGDTEAALHALAEALAMAEPGGYVRTFVNEGAPMVQLLSAALARGINPDYVGTLLAACGSAVPSAPHPTRCPAQPPIDPLSPRELDVLRLVAQGLSNREIADRLYLALDTVKGHNRVIFSKLQVSRRTEAVARARELGLL